MSEKDQMNTEHILALTIEWYCESQCVPNTNSQRYRWAVKGDRSCSSPVSQERKIPSQPVRQEFDTTLLEQLLVISFWTLQDHRNKNIIEITF